MKIEILPCHRNERSREIALRLRNLIALLPSPRTVRGNFQGRKLLNNGQKPRDEFKKGLGYSALNTARSALSCIIQSKKYCVFWLPAIGFIHRYVETWNIKVVLQFLANLYPPSKLTLKELTLKLVMLDILVSGQQGQSIHLLDINCMTQTETACFFCRHAQCQTV